MARAQLNLFLAMLISGLWHGAAWTFVLWGAWHGVLLAGHRLWTAVRVRNGWPALSGPLGRVVAVGGFFLLTVYGWVLFRAPDLDVAAAVMGAMATPWTFAWTPAVRGTMTLVAFLYALHWAEWAVRERWPERVGGWFRATPAPVRGLAYAAAAIVAMASYGTDQDFIYFRF